MFCANHLLITEDFNIQMDVADDAIKLCELLESVGLEQHVTVPTHISKHTRDLIITRQSDPLGISVPWTDYLFYLITCLSTVSSRSASPPLEKHRSLSGK